MSRTLGPAVLAVIALGAMIVAGWSAAGSSARGDRQAGVEIRIHYSRFVPPRVTVSAGRPVTFVIRNDDPIDHEWIVGDETVHERHRAGTEPVHDQRPTEVTVAALESRLTTVVFENPGTYRFVCHLPGHEAYGMTGVVIAEP